LFLRLGRGRGIRKQGKVGKRRNRIMGSIGKMK
jgi:hypothetical protein